MLADQVDYVVGVDTHRDEHVLAVVVGSTGAVVAQRSVAATSRGYGQALRFAAEQAPAAQVWAVEGAGHYGAGLARYLRGRGEVVLEAGRSPRGERRLRGEDDGLDAIRAARGRLRGETLASPKAGQRQEALRLLLLARRGAVDVRRQALMQLHSVIVTAPDQLRQELRGLPQKRLLDRCRLLRRSTMRTPDELAATLVLRTLARRVQARHRPRTADRPMLGTSRQAPRAVACRTRHPASVLDAPPSGRLSELRGVLARDHRDRF